MSSFLLATSCSSPGQSRAAIPCTPLGIHQRYRVHPSPTWWIPSLVSRSNPINFAGSDCQCLAMSIAKAKNSVKSERDSNRRFSKNVFPFRFNKVLLVPINIFKIFRNSPVLKKYATCSTRILMHMISTLGQCTVLSWVAPASPDHKLYLHTLDPLGQCTVLGGPSQFRRS